MDEVFYKIDKPANLHGLKGAALFREKRKDNEILSAMDEDTYEEFIASWAYYCVKNKAEGYQDVLRIGGKRLRVYTIVVFSFIRTFAPSF